jgi:hypothetical protein
MHHAMLVLIAQQKGPPPEAAAFIVIWLALMCTMVAVSIGVTVIVILHLIAMYRALNACRKRNRTMEPGMVFLAFVPLLNIVWHFFIVIRVAESLRNEFKDRGWSTRDEAFGYGMGLTAVILNLVGCFPVGVIFMIIHWRQIAAYTRQVESRG